jgi:hypothetical protein
MLQLRVGRLQITNFVKITDNLEDFDVIER